MSAEDNVNNIYRLNDAISSFNNVLNEVYGYNFSDMKEGGSRQWSGQKKQQYDNEFDQANNLFQSVAGEIEGAISDCQNQQYALANGIDPLEHPILYAEAWAAIVF